MEEKNIALLGFVSSAADYLKEQIKDDSEEIKTLEEVDLNKIKSELENKLGSSFDGAKNKSDDLINAGREVFDNFISKSPTLIDEFKDIFDVDFKKENDEKDEKIVSHLINILKKPQENDDTDELVNQIAKAASEATLENRPRVEANNANEDKELDSIFSEILANENIEEQLDSNPVEEELIVEEDNTLEDTKPEVEEPKLDPNEIKQLIKDTISEFFIDKKQEAEVKLDEVIDSFDVLKNAAENQDNKEEAKEDLDQVEQLGCNLNEDNIELEEVEYEELNPNNDSLLGGVFKRVDQPQEIEELVVEENATIEDVFVDDDSLEEENDESLDLELEDDDLKLAVSQLEDEVNNEQTNDSFITVDDILGSFDAPKVDDTFEINSALKEAEHNYLVNYETSYEESAPKKENKQDVKEEIVLNDFNIEEAIEKEFLEIQNRKADIEELKKTNDDDYTLVDGVLVSEAELIDDLNPVEEETTVDEPASSTKEDLSLNEEAELIDDSNPDEVEQDLNPTVVEEPTEETTVVEESSNPIIEETPVTEETEPVVEVEEKEEEPAEEILVEEELHYVEKDHNELANDLAKEVEELDGKVEPVQETVDSSLEKEEPEDLANLETLDLIFEELSKEHKIDSNPNYEELEAEDEIESSSDVLENNEETNPEETSKPVEEIEELEPTEESNLEEVEEPEDSDLIDSDLDNETDDIQEEDTNFVDEDLNVVEESKQEDSNPIVEEVAELVDDVEETVDSNDEAEELEDIISADSNLDNETDDVQEEDANPIIEEEPVLDEDLETVEEISEPVCEELDSKQVEKNVSLSDDNLDQEFSYDDLDNSEELLDDVVDEDSDSISLFDDVPLSQKLSSFTDQYEASDNPYSRDVDYPLDKDDYAFEVGRDDSDDSISSFLKELKENKDQSFNEQTNDIIADLIDQCKTLCPVVEEETEVAEEENEPIMIDNDYIEAYNNRTLEEMYIPNPGLDALESEVVEDFNENVEEEPQPEEVKEEVEANCNEDTYLNDLFADFTNNDYEVDEVSDKQKQEEARKKEVYDSIVALYPYLSNGFIKGVYDLKQSFANDYKDGEKIVILHRLRFEDINGLRQFVDVMINHGYLVNVDEKQMIVDTFKEHVNSDGKILTDIFEIANQAKLLTGDYDGYRIIEDEL